MDDTKYWNNFYENNKELSNCSSFCNFIIDFFKDKNIKNILDAGCGNGRDSYVLCNKYNVVGVDNCGIELNNCNNFTFINESFIDNDKSNYDLIYSRFTFHSINNNDQDLFLQSIKKNTYLAIEARSIKSMDIDHHYGTDHYRNYIDIKQLEQQLIKYNFKILFIVEDKDLAIYKDENPICVRVICLKM
jgi:SAM-dependent methyltransferase